MKECFKCHQKKPLTEFYKHSGMSGGILNKCKECTRFDVRQNRGMRINYYREYDRNRADILERVTARKRYFEEHRTDPEWQRKRTESRKQWLAAHPGRYKAYNKVSNSLRDGKLIRKPCEVCGNEKSQAHHHDYRKHLDVKWLCRKCHMDEHKKLRWDNSAALPR